MPLIRILAASCLIVLSALDASAGDAGPLRLRVLTYNIHHGEGVDGKLDLERIARIIKSVEPDVVALQEVDQNTDRTGKVDQPAQLAALTDLKVVFGDNIPYQGGKYGNAVLSRHPIRRTQNHALPNEEKVEQRGVLEVEFEIGVQRVTFLATHLDARRPDGQRVASASVINQLAGRPSMPPMILAGDLNDVPDSATLRALSSTWTRANTEVLPSIPVGRPTRQIDYVMTSPRGRWRTVECRVLNEPVASDHLPMLAVLELLPP